MKLRKQKNTNNFKHGKGFSLNEIHFRYNYD